MVAAHLGLGGAALAGSRWTGRAANIILLLILAAALVKVIAIGRFVIRRRKAYKTP